MNVRIAAVGPSDELPDALRMQPADRVHHPLDTDHAGYLEGATATGEASRGPLCARIGLWMDEDGGVRRARWRAVRDPALRACAEAACALLEAGADPGAIDADALHGAAAGGGRDRAEVIAAAVEAARLAAAPR